MNDSYVKSQEDKTGLLKPDNKQIWKCCVVVAGEVRDLSGSTLSKCYLHDNSIWSEGFVFPSMLLNTMKVIFQEIKDRCFYYKEYTLEFQ